MICLSDNDILLHLSAWNLLPEFQAFLQDTLKAPLSEVYVMNAFVSRLTRGDARWASQYGQPTLDRALRFCGLLKQVYSLPFDHAAVTALQNTEAIDEGEAILIAVAHHHPGSLILTNEWRFLGALAADPECSAYHAALQGRVLHLRQVVLALLDDKGHRFLEARVRTQPKSDGLIYRAFGQNASGARTTIQDSIAEVRRIGNGLLYAAA